MKPGPAGRAGRKRQVRLFLVLAAMLAGPDGVGAHSMALWRVVHDLCATDLKLTGRPTPCLAFDRAAGWAVLKDLRGKSQILLVPTVKVKGIEDPELLAPDGPNYWQAAWDARRWFERRVRSPVARDQIGMAVNSRYSRSQDQLHIHVDCVRADVRATLSLHAEAIGETWRPLGVELAGADYEAMRLAGAELGARDPFKLLAEGDPAAASDMGSETLAVIGATSAGGEPGFWLLAARDGPLEGPHASAERLLDHDCPGPRSQRLAAWPRSPFPR